MLTENELREIKEAYEKDADPWEMRHNIPALLATIAVYKSHVVELQERICDLESRIDITNRLHGAESGETHGDKGDTP